MAAQEQAVALMLMVVILCFPSHAMAEDEKMSKEELVRQKVLKDYQKNALPQRNHNDTLPITFSFFVMGAWIEENMQIIHTNAWVRMEWKDPRLAWDPKDYGGLKEIHVGSDEIWRPDVSLINNADIQETQHYGATNFIIMSDGSVFWVPPATFRAECALDLTLWPYDEQFCHLLLASWTRHGNQLDLQLFNNSKTEKVHSGWFMKFSHQWQFQGGTMRRYVIRPKTLPDPYIMLHIIIKLARISPLFSSTIVIPAIVVSVLTLLQFVLPVRNGLRVIMGCVTLVLCTLMLVYLASELPPLAQTVPIVVKFFGQTLGVTVVSIGVSAWLIKLTDTRQPSPMSAPPPVFLKTLLTGPLATLLCLGAYTDKVGHSGGGGDDGEVLDASRPASYAHEWLLVAAFIDRLAAIFFLAVFLITFIAHVAAV